MKRTSRNSNLPSKVGDLHASPSNPRRISDEARSALSRSMREFGDLSGLVFNVRTGHLVAGHQRTSELPSDVRIVRTAERKDSVGTVAVGHAEAHGTSWPVRFVDWPESKEKAANLAANSPLLAGEFTENLAGVLEDIGRESPNLIGPLRLDELFPQADPAAAVEELQVTKPIARVWVLIGLPADLYAEHAPALEKIAQVKDCFYDSTVR